MREKSTTSNQFEKYLAGLSGRLIPLYHPKVMGMGGHDVMHILRLVAMESEIAEYLSFNHYEYQTAVWLHNADRSPSLVGRRSLEKVLYGLLEPSPFNNLARSRIVTAVLEHGKKEDSPNDSTLLQALRLADKWDRIGALGVVDVVAFRGGYLPSYDPADPFGRSDQTTEGQIKTIYQGFFRILEWYAEFPLIRRLTKKHPGRMRLFLDFIRAFGSEVAERHTTQNHVEEDVKKALGLYYDKWRPRR